MSPKPEPTSKPNSPYPVWNAVEQLCQTIPSTWDTCNHSQRVELLESMARLIAVVTEQQVDEWEAQL